MQEARNLKLSPEQWREVQRRSRGPPRNISEIPLDSKALLNPTETMSALSLSRLRLQGHSYRIQDNPDRWAYFQKYLGLLPQHAPPARGDYVQPRHLWEVQSGKARGPDLHLPEADVCIDIAWYRHLTEADQKTLCAVRSPPVSRTVGRRGRVTLLLKNPDQPVQEANLRGITVSSHVSKLEPTAFYAVATAIYERALGGPCLVGGKRGISLQEVVRTMHMKLDPARLQHRIVDVLITDLAKFFDVIAQDIHPIVGARVGLGEADHLATHTEGFSYTLPLGPWQSHTPTQLLGTPQGTIQGVHAGRRQRSHSCGSWTWRTGLQRWSPSASRGSCGWTTRSSSWNGAIPALYKGSCWISGYTTRVSSGWMSLTARSNTARRPTRGPYGRLRRQPWPAT